MVWISFFVSKNLRIEKLSQTKTNQDARSNQHIMVGLWVENCF